ncbi:MAG: cation diffusion facilitator family transporter [Kiritimatiellia bacterium]
MIETVKVLDASAETRRVTWIGLIINIGLSALKFVVGFIGHSQAMVADAAHSFSDLVTDFAVLLGLRFWSAPADDSHPYGHQRIETIVTTLIGAALFAVGAGIGYHALATVRDPHIESPGKIALLGALFSIILKEWLYRWTVAVGQRIKSSAVIANAWHHRSDALSSIPALIAIGLAVLHPKLAFVDHIGALIVSLFIIKVSWNIVSPALNDLTDRAASNRECEEIRTVATGIPGVISVHALRTRRAGSSLHVDLHVLVDGGMTVKAGHDISETVKQAILDKGPHVTDVVVHLEPDEDRPEAP